MIVVTGANGFVGRAVCNQLQSQGYFIRKVVRFSSNKTHNEIEIGDISADTNWHGVLKGASTVIHCAARVHVMRESALDPQSEYRDVNVAGTLRLARQALEAGIKRFIFLSTIKVNGESSQLGTPFNPGQIPDPVDPYAVSKYEAEIGLMALSEDTDLEVVIIRSPLVYGPGVKGNFLSMIKWLWTGIPLPLGGVTNNRRSLIFIDNLVDVILICMKHHAAVNQTFMVSDDEDLSTSDLLTRMNLELGQPSTIMSVPTSFIILLAKISGKTEIARRLCDSLQVDIKKTKDLLGWVPPISVNEGLRQTAAYFLKST